jgi:hypothetical protein
MGDRFILVRAGRDGRGQFDHWLGRRIWHSDDDQLLTTGKSMKARRTSQGIAPTK